jgi:Arc/MetJ-type ribon-helix-helix transcriptional regulator
MKLLDRRDDAIIERNHKLQWLRSAFIKGQASGEPVELNADEFLARVRANKPQA